MTRCRSCLIPDTRPDTAFVAVECSACINHRNRPAIDWDQRKAELVRILETTPRNGSGYDCIVPSSGGKDSHYQVLTLLELGARPLVVTASTCMLTAVGRKNIDNLARYATTIEVTPNREVRRKLNRLGLELVGDISWPEHVSIFTTPFRVASDLGIKTIWYGECPQREYSGPPGSEQALTLTARWRSEYGGFLGLRPSDLIGRDGISALDMLDYELPNDERLAGVTAYFLGQFIGPWDSHRNAQIATRAGMQGRYGAHPSAANWWRLENLDNAMTGVHDFFGYLKYGYGRLCAQISVDIRAGLIKREAALKIVKRKDGLFPFEYMGVPLQSVLSHIGMTWAQWNEVVERFTNRDLFSHVEARRPILKREAEAA